MRTIEDVLNDGVVMIETAMVCHFDDVELQRKEVREQLHLILKDAHITVMKNLLINKLRLSSMEAYNFMSDIIWGAK